jgi:hypothetical protein
VTLGAVEKLKQREKVICGTKRAHCGVTRTQQPNRSAERERELVPPCWSELDSNSQATS